MYDSKIGRWNAKDPYGQYWNPYLGMGNNPINGVDPDGGLFGKLRAQITAFFTGGTYGQDINGNWLVYENVPYGDGLFVSKSVTGISEPIYAYEGDMGIKNVVVKNYGGSGFKGISSGSTSGMNKAFNMWWNFLSVHDKIMLTGDPSFDAIQPDYTIESFLIPFGKGASLVYNGTVRGVLKSSLAGASRLGESAAKINYYTYKASQAGYSTALSGARVEAGVFVQLNHNLGRLVAGKGWKTLYSNSAATIVGRQMQNQAVGSGLLGIGVGTGSLYYNLNK